MHKHLGPVLIIIGTAMMAIATAFPLSRRVTLGPALPSVVETPTDPEPSLADRIRALGATWEAERKATQEFHTANYRKHAAIIAELMGRLDVETITVCNEYPADLVVSTTEPAAGQVTITLRRQSPTPANNE